jgi:signal peptidase I
VRAVLAEPFGVSTGSMAPTLIGAHRAINCPRCGFPVRVGAPPNGASVQRHYAAACCPNCGRDDLGLDHAPDLDGDRLLVDKNVFEWRSPRRWEPVVFRGPDKPYVKRAVGLPGERVRVRDGDILINGTLARKTLAECRAMRVPVFDQTHAPPGGWSARWVVDSPQQQGEMPCVNGSELYLSGEGAESFRWLVYRNWLLDEQREDVLRDGFAYNGARDEGRLTAVHDFIVCCEIHVLCGRGEVACTLTDGQDTVTALLPVGRAAEGVSLDGGMGFRRMAPRLQLKPGRTHTLELAFVDRRAFLVIDGDELLPPLDLPPARNRPGVTRPLKLGTRGVAATVRNVRLYRDVHYSDTGPHGTRGQCPLGPDEYFMLGDNSGNSEDSRFWTTPGVPARRLLGKPLFIYQPRTQRRADWLGRPAGGQAVDWGRVGWVR